MSSMILSVNIKSDYNKVCYSRPVLLQLLAITSTFWLTKKNFPYVIFKMTPTWRWIVLRVLLDNMSGSHWETLLFLIWMIEWFQSFQKPGPGLVFINNMLHHITKCTLLKDVRNKSVKSPYSNVFSREITNKSEK